MAGERNKLIDLIHCIESLGVIVNLGKNKARGNKGIFCKSRDCYRIDISKNIDEQARLSTLLHEFAHYIHYKYDNSLKSLDFIFPFMSPVEQEELLKVTVNNVPKDFASSLFVAKEKYTTANKELARYLKSIYPEFKVSEPFSPLEHYITFPVKYFLKYDKIRLFSKVYAVETLENDFNYMSKAQISYIRLKSNQRKISRINSKINRLNKYYNQPSELWARFFELFFMERSAVKTLAPVITQKFETIVEKNIFPEFTMVNKIFN